jgi:hypothetical protein
MFDYISGNTELEEHQKARYKYYSIQELKDMGLLAKTKFVYYPISIGGTHVEQYRSIDEPFDF